jgi:hypothetical protein
MFGGWLADRRLEAAGAAADGERNPKALLQVAVSFEEALGR